MSVFVSIYKHTKIVYLLHEFPETSSFNHVLRHLISSMLTLRPSLTVR